MKIKCCLNCTKIYRFCQDSCLSLSEEKQKIRDYKIYLRQFGRSNYIKPILGYENKELL